MPPTRRFIVTAASIEGRRVTFDRDETRHMAGVLRLAPGDVVVAGDGRGRDYTVRIETLGERASGTVLGVSDSLVESALAITLVQGVPKGDKMEAIIRAVTELGVRRIAPALTARTIVRLEPGRWRERARRWQRVAREAAKQCGRSVVPDVEAPRPLAACLDEAGDLRVCLWEGDAPPLEQVLGSIPAPPRAVAVLVGPEGGLEPNEVAMAGSLGWRAARLGPRILRTETAGPAIVALLQFRFGDLSSGGMNP